MRRIAAFFLFFAMVSTVSADTISDLNIKIGGDGHTSVEERVIFESAEDYGIIYQPPHANDLAISDSSGNLTYEFTEIDGIDAIKINFRETTPNRKTVEVWIKYGTYYLTTKSTDIWTFNYQTPTTPRKTIMRVAYPPGSSVLTLQPTHLLRTNVDDGIWLYPQVGDENLNFTSTYRYGGVKILPSTTLPPSKQQIQSTLDIRLFYGLALGAVMLVLAAVIFYLYKIRRQSSKGSGRHMTVDVAENVVDEPKTQDGKISYQMDSSGPKGAKAVKESILKILDETERNIVQLLENSEDEEVTQAYIYKTTGIPKSSLSDILRHIEKRNIIERRVEGRVKWIKLKKWVLE
ncbi:MAG: hypothetical protein V1875_01705 [Candidatus Altiarchaeota archaeon]